jgi:hypothetical protein
MRFDAHTIRDGHLRPTDEAGEEEALMSPDNALRVGATVDFTDEHGKSRRSKITRIVPIGEFSATEIAYAVGGDFGSYLRTADQLRTVETPDDDDGEPTECECGDKLDSEGNCPGCRAYQEEFAAEWEATGRREYERELTYEQDMIEAGRGHLLGDSAGGWRRK